jgi:hypothetical protein
MNIRREQSLNYIVVCAANSLVSQDVDEYLKGEIITEFF